MDKILDLGPRFSNFHIFMGRANFVSWPIVSDGDAAAAWIWPSLGSFKLTRDASLMNGRHQGVAWCVIMKGD